MQALLAVLGMTVLTGCGHAGPPEETAPQAPEPAVLTMAVPDLDRDVAAAVEACREAVQANRSDAASWIRFAQTLHANALYEPALEAYDVCRTLDPEEPRWPYHMSRCSYELGQLDEARSALEASLALAPDEPGLHWHRGQLALEANHPAEAREAFEHLVGIAEGRSGGHVGLAQLALGEGRSEDALAALDRAVQRQPQDGFAHHLRAIALRLVGRDDDAEEAQARGADARPLFPFVWDHERDEHRVQTLAVKRTIAMELFNQGRFPEAVRVLESLTPRLEDDLAHLRFLGRAYLRAGRVEDARAAYTRCLELTPTDRGSRVGRIETALVANDRDAAWADVTLALEAHADYGPVHHFHGVLLRQEQRYQAAADAFRTCLAVDQRNAPTHLALGQTLLELRDWDGARDAFEGALAVNADLGDAHAGLGRALVQLGQFQAASEALDRATSLDVRDRAALRKSKRMLETRMRAAQQPSPGDGQ